MPDDEAGREIGLGVSGSAQLKTPLHPAEARIRSVRADGGVCVAAHFDSGTIFTSHFKQTYSPRKTESFRRPQTGGSFIIRAWFGYLTNLHNVARHSSFSESG